LDNPYLEEEELEGGCKNIIKIVGEVLYIAYLMKTAKLVELLFVTAFDYVYTTLRVSGFHCAL
jgi:hypothetical protein